jgi:hypothetical protein
MRNVAVEVVVAFRDEAGLFVERDRMGLRVQFHLGPAERARLLDERAQERIADTASAPVAQHGHAAYRAFGREPRRADGGAVRGARNDVARQRIECVDFFLDRHALFDDENLLSDRAQRVAVAVPVRGFDMEIVADHVFLARSSVKCPAATS